MYILNGYIEPDWKIHMCDVRRSEIAILMKWKKAPSLQGEVSSTKSETASSFHGKAVSDKANQWTRRTR